MARYAMKTEDRKVLKAQRAETPVHGTAEFRLHL